MILFIMSLFSVNMGEPIWKADMGSRYAGVGVFV